MKELLKRKEVSILQAFLLLLVVGAAAKQWIPNFDTSMVNDLLYQVFFYLLAVWFEGAGRLEYAGTIRELLFDTRKGKTLVYSVVSYLILTVSQYLGFAPPFWLQDTILTAGAAWFGALASFDTFRNLLAYYRGQGLRKVN